MTRDVQDAAASDTEDRIARGPETVTVMVVIPRGLPFTIEQVRTVAPLVAHREHPDLLIGTCVHVERVADDELSQHNYVATVTIDRRILTIGGTR